ncbi:pentapeptide repeat-containing protein [Amycolatopsis sp. NPDC021455]|uniref:pentapeptide repeat-containing protein n=1 Tax=Amycolatopsis sp. NPDC021455 TaxID=3154901 RepID=UPI00340BF66C
MAAIGALAFTALSLRTTQEQNEAQNSLAAQAQYTDRYTKAVDQLGQKGDDRLQIRLGGIYALERLAHDSPRDQPTIIEVLSAFVRTSSPNPGNFVGGPALGEPVGGPPADHPNLCNRISTDVQAAVTVLGRRDVTHDQSALPDLSGACLQLAYLSGANLRGSKLRGTVFTGAYLYAADLGYADLGGAYLKDSNLHGALLNNAQLSFANLVDADVTGADLRDAIHGGRTQIGGIKSDEHTLGRWW